MKGEDEQTAVVHVLAQDGTPLMSTRRCGRVKHLLKEKLAWVVNLEPFTIRLLYESSRFIQEMSDDGSGLVSKYVPKAAATGTEDQTEPRTDSSKKTAAKIPYWRYRKKRYSKSHPPNSPMRGGKQPKSNKPL